ncbi:MAG: RND transporter, partial [Acidimicrobiales bacterium]
GTAVGAVADASSGVATFPVTVTFTAPADEFFVGATVTAKIVTSATGDVVQVPSLAITTAADGTTTVLVSTDGSTTNTKQRTVATGTTSNGMTEIRSGLADGEQVVVRRGFGPGGARAAAGGAPTGSSPSTTAGGGGK